MAEPSLKIVFMGTPDFAVPSLKALADSPHEIVAVVTGTDKKRGRGGALSPTPVKKTAIALNLPVIEADKMKSPDLQESLKELAPDLIVIVAFKILPDDILNIPKKGSINLHASLLPKYRGAAPIHWAVINGEKETGNTVFFLDSGIDTGKILLQDIIAIGPNDTTGDVYNELMKRGGSLIRKAVDSIADGTYQLKQQDEATATPAPKIFPDDCIVDPEKSAVEVHNFIRGMHPFPGAWFWLDDQKFKIHESRLLDFSVDHETGSLAVVDKKLLLSCNTGCVELSEVQLQGRKSVSGTDFINGYSGKLQTRFS